MHPDKGNVKQYKMALFTDSILKGYVDREDKKSGTFIEKRPRIRFTEIVSEDHNRNQTDLFEL